MHLTEYQTPETWRAVTMLVAAPCGGLFNYKVLETCSVSCCSFQMKKKRHYTFVIMLLLAPLHQQLSRT